MKLTDTFLRSVKGNGKPQKHADGGGLFLFVTPTGSRLWRMAYRFAGKQKLLSFGPYPTIGLKDARELREAAKKQLAAGIDPGAHKQAVKAAAVADTQNSFEIVAREWLAKYSVGWTESNKIKVTARLENGIFPYIGTKPVNQITPPELLAVLRRVESRGAVDTAHRTLQDCGRIFRYAVATGRAERDPAADLKGALAPVKGANFASITTPKAVGALLRAIDGYEGAPLVACALRLAPLVFVRPGELRKAEWAEIDVEAAEWRIPPERMKMRQTHIVPLSRQALAILEELHPLTGRTRFLFPSLRAPSTAMSDMTLLSALRRLGYGKDEMTVHGFRSMASTLLNELGYNRDWIERQLAHGERNGIRAAYNYAEYLSERRRMMQEYADYLDELRCI